MSKTRIRSKATPDLYNIDQQYKQYRNICNRVIYKAQSQYKNVKFTVSKNNIKQTGTNIKNIFHVPKMQHLPSSFQIDNQMCNDTINTSNAFHNYFVNVGPKLANKIKTTNNYTDDMQNQLPNSLGMEETTSAEIIKIIQNIKYWI